MPTPIFLVELNLIIKTYLESKSKSNSLNFKELFFKEVNEELKKIHKKSEYKRGYMCFDEFMSINPNDKELLLIKNLALNDPDTKFNINRLNTRLNIKFLECSFKNQVNFEDFKNNDSISFENCTFEKRLRISSKKNGIPTKKSKSEIYREKNKINFLGLVNCTCLDDIRIGHSNINTLEIENLKILGDKELNIGEVNVENLDFHAIRNAGSIRIYNLNKNYKKYHKNPNKYSFSNNNFGNLELQNVNFQSFKIGTMFENLFQNCLYSDVKWSEDILGESALLKTEKFEKYLIQQQNTYRMLKNIAKSNNDRPQELEFYSEEMKIYQRIINTKYNLDKKINPDKQFIFYPLYLIFSMIGFMMSYLYDYTNNLNKNKKIKSIDILTLEFSKINDFGLNWFRPFYILIYLNLLFILIYYLFSFILLVPHLTQNFIYFTTYINILNIINLIYSIPLFISQLLNQVFLLLNPLNTFEFVTKENVHPIWEVFRNLLSIINAILIYQIIVAFRKFSRK
ncbi:MAG: hypothetical protein LAT82_03210 [Nanoarchaeota archaeon]|nr:hypothetical protein [Nanoarchaeota archaeon]